MNVEAGAKTELIHLSEKKIDPCLDCVHCHAPENKYCI